MDDTIVERTLPDGRILSVIPLTYGRGRVTIARDRMFYDDAW
jgi:hypothetical protein